MSDMRDCHHGGGGGAESLSAIQTMMTRREKYGLSPRKITVAPDGPPAVSLISMKLERRRVPCPETSEVYSPASWFERI